MAYTSGTAANYKDLLAVMATFAAANGWVVLEQSDTQVYLKGTGLAGLDEIYVGVRTYEDAANSRYNWELYGSWGWVSGRGADAHPMTSYNGTIRITAHMWNSAIPYWMIANPRRIIVVAKVGTTYQHVHLGLLTPPATDAQYPYPLYIGGGYNSRLVNYSSTSLSAYWSQATSGSNECAVLSLPSGPWAQEYKSAASYSDSPAVIAMTPYFGLSGTLLTSPSGDYLLEPIYICTLMTGAPAIYGLIDGVYAVTGYGQTAENIITVDGVNYMVFPNIYRATYSSYCALRLN